MMALVYTKAKKAEDRLNDQKALDELNKKKREEEMKLLSPLRKIIFRAAFVGIFLVLFFNTLYVDSVARAVDETIKGLPDGVSAEYSMALEASRQSQIFRAEISTAIISFILIGTGICLVAYLEKGYFRVQEKKFNESLDKMQDAAKEAVETLTSSLDSVSEVKVRNDKGIN